MLASTFADVLQSLNFTAGKAENDIWMRRNKGVYEYITGYVNDLLIPAKELSSIIKALS
jgi:hypothetical protein